LKLLEEKSGCMVGLVKNEVKVSSFDSVLSKKKGLGPNLIKLAEVLGK
jgi:hypothetical protein